MRRPILLAAISTLLAAPTFADVIVSFDEGAPKDRFTLTNAGDCPLGKMTVVLDLGASAAGLIFDVTEKGAGVSVFQPLEFVAGQEFLMSVPEVRDGDTRLELSIDTLGPGQSIAFTIDVDDTAGSSATMISGAEIQGARVLVGNGTPIAQARFSRDAVARVAYNSCSA